MIDNKETDGSFRQMKGDIWEWKCLVMLHKLGYKQVGTTKLWDRELDKLGVDICSTDELIPFNYNISCKSTSSLVNYRKILQSLPNDTGKVNVILHEAWDEGIVKGSYAILNMSDFINLLKI